MIEYDDDGKEWFGYTLSSEAKDPERVIAVFLGNVQYVEFRYRQHGKFEEDTPSIARVHTLSVKVAVLLSFLEYPVDDPSDALWTRHASPFLQRQLDQTDVPAGNRSTIRALRKPARSERDAEAVSRSKICDGR
jgi:hypothetical protein